jgi:hypothetical protein
MKLTSHENSAHAVVIGKNNSRVSVWVAAMAPLGVMQAASVQSTIARCRRSSTPDKDEVSIR